MKTERTKNSIYNSFSSVAVNFSVTIFSFIVRTIFIKKLGEQFLGIDGLFTNILSLLSLAELGFSTAISFSLYEPLAKNENSKINKLMIYFKKAYKNIGIIILIIGLCLMPFLHFIVKDYTISDNIYLIYIFYLFNTVSSYFTSYSAILIEADQKNYKLTGFRLLFNFLTYGSQLIILIIFNSFIYYLLAQLIIRQLERIIVHHYIKKTYKEIDFNSSNKIDNFDKADIKKNIKGIIFHRVGDYAVNGTDNILISSIINISMTGIYSNYLSLISIIRNLIASIISSTTSSFGNLNVLEESNTKKDVFDLINFLCNFMTGLSVIGLFFCLNPFITFWIGEKYTLDILCVSAICLNFYLNCVMLPITSVKNSVGLYYIDRYVPMAQAIINLAISIILGIKIGILGILLGTCISSILTVNIVKPYIIYKYVFKSSCVDYFKKMLKSIFLILISIIFSIRIFNFLIFDDVLIKFIFYGVISVTIYLLIFVILYFNNVEYKYFVNMMKSKSIRK